MTIRRLAPVGGALLAVVIVGVVWYSVAANYDYDALAGTYVLQRDGEKCTLYLRPDQTFMEELNRSGVVQEAQGRWRRYGEAHVSFSGSFLKISGRTWMLLAKLTDSSINRWGFFRFSRWLLSRMARPSERSCFTKLAR